MPTYNHEEYIAQAIESVVNQETDFPFELIIGEDCSTDSTREIVKAYAEKYPEIVKPILYEKNVGLMNNYTNLFDHCAGKYIACCDGDDYFTDMTKLQQQADILDEMGDVAIVSHGVSRLYTIDGHIESNVHMESEELFDLDYFLIHNNIDSSAMMFRKEVIDRDKPNIWNRLTYGDHLLKTMCLQYGKGYFIHKDMTCYRVITSSYVHRNAVGFLEKQLKYYRDLCTYIPEKKKQIHFGIEETRLQIAKELLKDGDKEGCRMQFHKMQLDRSGLGQLELMGKYISMLSRESLKKVLSLTKG